MSPDTSLILRGSGQSSEGTEVVAGQARHAQEEAGLLGGDLCDCSTFAYNEHGELATSTDARGVTVTPTMDALDRVTAITHPTSALGIAYTYDLFAAGAWCALVLYVIASVNLFGLTHPLGRGPVASWVYSLLLMHPHFPHGGKLDLPIALIHALGLHKSSQWIWRHRKP